MPILTKPALVEKGIAAEFELDKMALAAHAIVAADEYFSSPNNWSKIHVKFKSDVGGQFEVVEFDASIASPVGRFFVSNTAKNLFEVEKITIIDHDGGILIIPRSELTVAEFDIDFTEAPEVELNNYEFNSTLLLDGVVYTNNNLSVEKSNSTYFSTVLVTPSILLNSGKKVYTEFTIDNIGDSVGIGFGAIFRTTDPTVSELQSGSIIFSGGQNSSSNYIGVRDNLVFSSNNIVNYNFGGISNGVVVGIGFDLLTQTAFVTRNGVKSGEDFSMSSALGFDVTKFFFMVSIKNTNQKFTLNSVPMYTLPVGYEFIGP